MMCKPESVSKLELAIQLLQESAKEVIDDVSYLSNEISRCDLELTDLEHYIEFANFNASEGYLIAKEMKDLLIRRREIKNQMELIQSLEQMVKDRDTQFKNLSKVTAKINKREHQIKNKLYAPRVRMDLFERLKTKGVNIGSLENKR